MQNKKKEQKSVMVLDQPTLYPHQWKLPLQVFWQQLVFHAMMQSEKFPIINEVIVYTMDPLSSFDIFHRWKAWTKWSIFREYRRHLPCPRKNEK